MPASVTPPPSWRRAAWFIIGTSTAALIGLLAVTSTLVGPTHLIDRFGGLASVPSGVPFTAAPGPGRPAGGRPAGGRPGLTDPQRGTTIAGAPGLRLGNPGNAADAGAHATAGNLASSGSSPVIAASTSGLVAGRARPVGAASATTRPAGRARVGKPSLVDPTGLTSRTQRYVREAASEVAVAAELTATSVRQDILAVIHRKYQGMSEIEVRPVPLDPRGGAGVGLVLMPDNDGMTSAGQRTLRWHEGADSQVNTPDG